MYSLSHLDQFIPMEINIGAVHKMKHREMWDFSMSLKRAFIFNCQLLNKTRPDKLSGLFITILVLLLGKWIMNLSLKACFSCAFLLNV